MAKGGNRKPFDLGSVKNRLLERRRMKPGELADHPGQAWDHPEQQAAALAGILRELGQVDTIKAYHSERAGGKLVCIDGHLRRSLDPDLEWDVDVLDLTDAEADYMLAVFDPVGSMKVAAKEALDALLCTVNSGESAVQAMLADQAAAAGLYIDKPQQDAPEPQIDKAAELQAKWGTASGQLWRLGEHRLYVGDAQAAGIRCDFAVYDPPWDWATERQDACLGWTAYKNALVMGLAECFGLATRQDYVSFFVWDQLTGVGISNTSKYLTHRSLVLMLWFGERERFYKDDALRVLHAAGLAETFRSDVPQYLPIVRKYGDGKAALHSSVKPMLLCEYLLTLFSRPGEAIGDPFAGSGSFLIAAQNTGRLYHGAEIDPAYCAVILERYREAFAVTAELDRP